LISTKIFDAFDGYIEKSVVIETRPKVGDQRQVLGTRVALAKHTIKLPYSGFRQLCYPRSAYSAVRSRRKKGSRGSKRAACQINF